MQVSVTYFIATASWSFIYSSNTSHCRFDFVYTMFDSLLFFLFFIVLSINCTRLSNIVN